MSTRIEKSHYQNIKFVKLSEQFPGKQIKKTTYGIKQYFKVPGSHSIIPRKRDRLAGEKMNDNKLEIIGNTEKTVFYLPPKRFWLERVFICINMLVVRFVVRLTQRAHTHERDQISTNRHTNQ